jgi:16S rRNA (cytosine967-C5)-methyltransferase
MLPTSRQLAFQALRAVYGGAFADIALDRVLQQAKVSSNDRRLITELVYGSVRRQRTLDALIDQFAKKPASQQPPDLRLILHLGLYQLRYLSHIPAAAAVDTTVELAKLSGFKGLAGFVNGLLRQYLRQCETQDCLVLPADLVGQIAIRHSYPDWIVQLWLEQFGQSATEQLCEWFNRTPTLDLRINPLKASIEQVEAALKASDISVSRITIAPHLAIADPDSSDPNSSDSVGSDSVGSALVGSDSVGSDSVGSNASSSDAPSSDVPNSDAPSPDAPSPDVPSPDVPSPDVPNSDAPSPPDLANPTLTNPGSAPSVTIPQALRITSSTGAIQNLPGFAEGWWTVQDGSAQLVSHLLDPQPHELVIDACAAPGGKTTHIAELMRDQGQIWAYDRHSSRLKKLRENMARLQLSAIQFATQDSRYPPVDQPAQADRVLLDVPCSGLGTLHRHADARWRQTPKTIQELAQLQAELLEQAATWVKPQGVLVYATCTLHPSENEAIIQQFLYHHPDWQISPPPEANPAFPFQQPEGWVKLLPHQHNLDGFFMVRLVRWT